MHVFTFVKSGLFDTASENCPEHAFPERLRRFRLLICNTTIDVGNLLLTKINCAFKDFYCTFGSPKLLQALCESYSYANNLRAVRIHAYLF